MEDTTSTKPDCCLRAEAAGGDCPHDLDPEFFGPGDHAVDDECPYGRSHTAGPCSACTDG